MDVVIGQRYWITWDARPGTLLEIYKSIALVQFDVGGQKWVDLEQLHPLRRH